MKLLMIILMMQRLGYNGAHYIGNAIKESDLVTNYMIKSATECSKFFTDEEEIVIPT